MIKNAKELVNYALSLILDSEVRQIVEAALELLPAYWWVTKASKAHHPEFTRGFEGLVRHSVFVAHNAFRLADAWHFNVRDRAIAVGAALLHDGLKHGASEDAGKAVHEHPVLMAKFLRDNFPGNEIAESMANAIASHMGRWTVDSYGVSNVVLPEPETVMQRLISAADMFASDDSIEGLTFMRKDGDSTT